MFIPFQLSQQTGESVGPNGERAPNTFTSTIAVLRRVPNGGTVVLGGVLAKNDSESTNRIPLLADLPIIGRLFRSKLINKNDVETLIVSGDAAEEIVKVAETRNAGVIVMGLHASELFGPRMGSVTYRVLCQTRALVLALPPRVAETSAETVHATGLAQVLV